MQSKYEWMSKFSLTLSTLTLMGRNVKTGLFKELFTWGKISMVDIIELSVPIHCIWHDMKDSLYDVMSKLSSLQG